MATKRTSRRLRGKNTKSRTLKEAKRDAAYKKASKFAQRLKSVRILRGFGSRELSLKAKGDVTAVSRIELGRATKVSTEFAGRLARVLCVSRVWLCWGEGTPSSYPNDLSRYKIEEIPAVSVDLV